MVAEKAELRALFNIETAFDEDIEDALDHGYLVSNLAYRVAEQLGYPEDFCSLMADAGMVHDIGKLKLGDYLYGRRQNALRIEEMRYVRMHPVLGFEILTENQVEPEELRQIVKHHHENYDGSGYPDNLKGEEIPIGSRILRVCDVYSALISDRPYRASFDKDTAVLLMIDEIKNFDMQIFLALMTVIHDDSFTEVEDFVSRCNSKIKKREGKF